MAGSEKQWKTRYPESKTSQRTAYEAVDWGVEDDHATRTTEKYGLIGDEGGVSQCVTKEPAL